MRHNLVLWLLLILPFAALGDGVVIPPTALPDPVDIPDQRALISYSNGVERLVIETRFTGTGTNFAWVVPLPTKPVIEAATPGLFPTVAFQLRPEVYDGWPPLFPIYGACLSLLYLQLFVRKGRAWSGTDIVMLAICIVSVLLISIPTGIMLACLLPWTIVRVMDGREGRFSIFASVFLTFLFGSMFLSALGTAGRVAGLPEGVTEVEHERVGTFDVSVVTSRNPTALTAWLRTNQFAVNTNIQRGIDDYVKDGWVFTVAKLHRETNQGTGTIHPLSFTFPSATPIYPMRLTAEGSKRLRVELYVFGPGRATARDFSVERCAAVRYPPKNYYQSTLSEIMVIHPTLAGWVQGSTTVTKLTASLTPKQMRQDVHIGWDSANAYQRVVYSWKGALVSGVNWASAVMLAVFLAAAFPLAFKPLYQQKIGKIFAVLGTIGFAVFVVRAMELPTMPVHSSKRPERSAADMLRDLGSRVSARWKGTPPKSLAEAEAEAADCIRDLPMGDTNLLLGGRIQGQDSPGNYIVSQTTNGFQFVWFNSEGGLNLFDPDAK
ncbi:MAG: DUF2330 domain-containing protein [Verrucomicrobiota bacterium]|jgi:hypothetical protein